MIPGISEKEALGKAIDKIKATRYSWQIPSMESDIITSDNILAGTIYPKGEMIVCRDVIKTNSIYRLAYKFEISAVEPLSQKIYYVDAITGNILNVRDLIFYTTANGATLYSGTVNIETVFDPQLSKYKLYETRTPNNIIIHTYTANDNSTLPPPVNTEITNNSTTWSEDSAAIDAHWGTEKVIDYWWSFRGRNSLDNSGMAINSYVHYGNEGDADQSFWSGGYDIICYGDGFQRFKPTVSLDMVAHETGHGIMKYTGVFQSDKENRSLNEGFSDIWGAVIEHWAAPNDPYKNTWKIGEQVMENGKDCLRSLRNPNTEGDNLLTGHEYPGGYPDT